MMIVSMKTLKTATVIVLATVFAVSSGSQRIGFDKYHNYAVMTDYLTQITNEFSNMSSLYSIGKSVLNRELWVVKLTTATELLGVPNIKIVGNIHGNEPVGREIILHLIQYLLVNNYGNNVINKLLRTTVIHLLPSMNPDGFELSTPQPCPSNRFLKGSRGNANSYDLNRNFPDIFNPHSNPLQPETKAIIEWMKSVPFVMSLGLHGGALVANYPYDGSENSVLKKLEKLNTTLQIANIVELYKAYKCVSNSKTQINESLTPDDDVFRFLAKQYAKLHPTMHMGQSCTNRIKFNDGITNGASWYQIIGSMQDYNYAWHGCLEITLEMSCCKYPPASFLESHWNDNLKPLINWMQQAQMGIKGIVTNRLTGEPLPNATLSISNRQKTFNTTKNGEYWKILLPGVYKMHVNAVGYEEKIVEFEVLGQTAENPVEEGPQPRLVDVAMDPLRTTTAKSTVNHNDNYYTYWVLNRDRVSTTGRVAVAARTTVRLDPQQQQQPPTVQRPYGDDERVEEFERNRVFSIVTIDDQDDVELQLMRSPLPTSPSSATAGVPFCSASDCVTTTLVALCLFLYYVVA